MDTGKWNIPIILKRMLEIVMILAPALMVVLPFMIAPHQGFANAHISGTAKNPWITLAFLEVCGVFCWLILLFLHKMLKTTIKNSPFVYKNVNYLKYISL